MKIGVSIGLICLILLVAVTLARRYPWQSPLRVPIQANVKLFTVTNGITSNTVVFPRSIVLSLVLAVPAGRPEPFDGHDVGVEIWSDGKLVFAKNYSLASVQRCNWLDREGLDGFFLDNLEEQSAFIKSACIASNATFSLSISNASIGSTVWVKYRRLSGWKLLP